jgi:LemA protein
VGAAAGGFSALCSWTGSWLLIEANPDFLNDQIFVGGGKVTTIILLAILLGLGLGVGLYAVGLYNSLVRGRNEVQSSWSSIDVQLKRRHDLIPNLVESVKGYAGHERETLDAVVKARQQAMTFTGGVQERAQLEGALTQTLRTLFAVAEAYPDLKANQNFLQLQGELAATENKIGFARQYYNDAAMRYKNWVEMFPSSILASSFNFQSEPFFQLEDVAERVVPQVKF